MNLGKMIEDLRDERAYVEEVILMLERLETLRQEPERSFHEDHIGRRDPAKQDAIETCNTSPNYFPAQNSKSN